MIVEIENFIGNFQIFQLDKNYLKDKSAILGYNIGIAGSCGDGWYLGHYEPKRAKEIYNDLVENYKKGFDYYRMPEE